MWADAGSDDGCSVFEGRRRQYAEDDGLIFNFIAKSWFRLRNHINSFTIMFCTGIVAMETNPHRVGCGRATCQAQVCVTCPSYKGFRLHCCRNT